MTKFQNFSIRFLIYLWPPQYLAWPPPSNEFLVTSLEGTHKRFCRAHPMISCRYLRDRRTVVMIADDGRVYSETIKNRHHVLALSLVADCIKFCTRFQIKNFNHSDKINSAVKSFPLKSENRFVFNISIKV